MRAGWKRRRAFDEEVSDQASFPPITASLSTSNNLMRSVADERKIRDLRPHIRLNASLDSIQDKKCKKMIHLLVT
ncbi:hypothetical protein IEQ34_020026 [Dendrobium chrysotoxum]|uniref:Uncharacterized protein n=1 Tax=Dendrobium chrysotoxum TaxID=161865 RepID=A0AAV7G8X3_DENCH|nr:hypothetical protein IEQ34_020026 [Dendrobium chrysotoxum]